MLDELLDDVKFGLRLIRKNPALSAATILTFTLGIGLDAGVFTVIDGLLFRPRVAHDPPSFVDLRVDVADARGRAPVVPLVSLQDYDALTHATSLHDLAPWTPVRAAVVDTVVRCKQVARALRCRCFA